MNPSYGIIQLRAMEPEDAPFTLKLLNDSRIGNMVVGCNLSVSLYEEEQWIKNFHNTNQCIRWIAEFEDGTRLGTVIVHSIDWVNRTVGVDIKVNINEPKRKHGDAKDAYYAALCYVFDELNLNRVTAKILEYNLPSLNLFKTMGFKEEGVIRSAVFKSGSYHNLIIMGLLRDDFIRYEDGSAPWQIDRQ